MSTGRRDMLAGVAQAAKERRKARAVFSVGGKAFEAFSDGRSGYLHVRPVRGTIEVPNEGAGTQPTP